MEHGKGGNKEGQSCEKSNKWQFWDLHEWWFPTYSACLSGQNDQVFAIIWFSTELGHYTYGNNYWSNEHTMQNYLMFPYLEKKKARIQLELDYLAPLLFDNFKAQCTEYLLKLLNSKNVGFIIIPTNCTNRLQPLDLSILKNFYVGSFRSGMPCRSWISTKER